MQITQEARVQRLEMAIALLQDADASMQTALGATEECFELHCAIENVSEEIQTILDRINAE